MFDEDWGNVWTDIVLPRYLIAKVLCCINDMIKVLCFRTDFTVLFLKPCSVSNPIILEDFQRALSSEFIGMILTLGWPTAVCNVNAYKYEQKLYYWMLETS